MATPTPSSYEVLQLAGSVLGLLVTLGGVFVGVNREISKRQNIAQKAQAQQETGNLAEATRLRKELRADLQAEKDRTDAAEAEIATWRAAFYALRTEAGRLLNNALNVCHRAQSELEANRHPEAARRLGLLIETLERVTLPPSPEEAERPVALRGVKFPPDKE